MASAVDSTRLPASHQGPVTRALAAMRVEPEPQPERRGFLRGLLALPLIGGAVSLIGAPSAVATPVSIHLMEQYREWLASELGETMIELRGMKAPPERAARAMTWCRDWCRDNRTLGPEGSFEEPPAAPPSTRAALVLSAVGRDWQGRPVA